MYRNSLATYKSHFRFHKPLSLYAALRLVKVLDERHQIFTEAIYARKTIKFEYNLNEPTLPISNKDILGEKYSSLSLYIGYRHTFPSYIRTFYAKVSLGADYNTNVMSFISGNGKATQEISSPVYYQASHKPDIG